MTLGENNQDQFFEILYREMFNQLNIYAQNALRDRSLGEEAVQDTFRIACTKIDELMASSNPKGWLIMAITYINKPNNPSIY
jgi:RNA polymerase sigma-70 factor (ECF subfamily)